MGNILLKADAVETKAIDTDNTADWIPSEVFINMIQTEARPNLVMRDIAARVDRSMIGSPGNTARVQIRGTTSFESVSEGDEIPTGDDIEHNSVDVEVSKVGRRILIESESQEDSVENIAQGAAVEIAEAFSKKNNQDAYDVVADSSLSDAITVDTETDGEITADEVIQLRQAMKANSVDPDVLLVHPDQYGDLLTEDKIQEVDKYGSREPIYNGEVGYIGGVRIVEMEQANPSSSDADEIQAVMIDSDRAFVEAVKRELTVRRKFVDKDDNWQFSATARYGHKVVDEEAVGHLKNASA